VVTVRVYRTGDRAAVVDLWDRTGISRPWNDLGAELDRHPHPGLCLVAEGPGGAVIGAVMGSWDGRRGWVNHLAVDAQWQRRGVARALVAEVEARLLSLGAPKVQLLVRGENFDVTGFYEKCGYAAEDMRFMSKWLVRRPSSPGT
jgi:ribosomal protein S18 acetylase RimI-like enzyme